MSRPRRDQVVTAAVALAVAVVLLGPALAPGFVLLRDMVFVPRQPLTAASVGLSSALPRAVPQDAVVAVLSVALPGEVLQKLALVAIVVGGFTGVVRMLDGCALLVRLVGGTSYVWSAYLVERLLLGHWSLLLAFAALPWLVALTRRARPWWAYVLPLGVGSLTPAGSVLVGVAAVACAATVSRRTALRLAAVAVAISLTWLAPTLTSPTADAPTAAGFRLFAPRAESTAGWLGSLLGLGGVWNAEAVPASRGTVLAPLLTALVLAVAVVGYPGLRRLLGRSLTTVLLGLAVTGLLLASAGPVAVLLGAEDALVRVPGAGLLRDGQKWVAWCALPLAAGFALGASRLAAMLAGTGLRRRLVLVAALCLPVAALPDAAWGAWGRLTTTDYPGDWGTVAAAVADGPPDDRVVSLPWSTFRAPAWNGRRPVLDPLPRWLDRRVVSDDRLVVDGVAVPGEDPLAAEVAEALDLGTPLTELGVGWVVVATPTAAPPTDGAETATVPGDPGVSAAGPEGFRRVLAGPSLELWRADRPVVRSPEPTPPRGAVVVAWTVAGAALVAAAAGAVLDARAAARSLGRRKPPARVRPG